MKPLTKEEMDLLLGEGEFFELEWVPYEELTIYEKERRKLYANVRKSLVRKGLIKITTKGKKECGGYTPPEFDFTPFGEQVLHWLETIRSYKNKLIKMRKLTKCVKGAEEVNPI